MYFTERIEEHMASNGGHIGYFVPYVSGKTAIRSYSIGDGALNDKANILMHYEDRNLDVQASDIDRASLLALGLSGSTYQLALQIARMFAGRSTAFKSWEWRGIQLPHVSTYLNIDGLSMKVSGAYRKANWRFPAAIERQYKGDTRLEVSAGAIGEYGPIRPTIKLTMGETVEPELDLLYQVTPNFSAGAGYVAYDQRNLNGERMIPSLDGSDRYHEFYLRATMRY